MARRKRSHGSTVASRILIGDRPPCRVSHLEGHSTPEQVDRGLCAIAVIVREIPCRAAVTSYRTEHTPVRDRPLANQRGRGNQTSVCRARRALLARDCQALAFLLVFRGKLVLSVCGPLCTFGATRRCPLDRAARVRPNPSLEPTRSGKAHWPPRAAVAMLLSPASGPCLHGRLSSNVRRLAYSAGAALATGSHDRERTPRQRRLGLNSQRAQSHIERSS